MVSDVVRAHCLISGRVQGVFFRYEAAERARTRRLAGWVRNLPDGRVEAVFEGPRDAVDSMIRWCGEGPPMAEVEGVETDLEEPKGESGFVVR